MNKLFIYLIIGLFFSQQLAQSQDFKDKNVLIVWGGWEGHNPKLFSEIFENFLNKNLANVTVSNNLEVYSNLNYLLNFDLIIQSVTQSEISNEQEKNLLSAIKSGVGFAGAHGGILDSFRKNTNYHFMTGGQWVEHPGGMIKFMVNIVDNELTVGIDDFEIYSEQYYIHYDPEIDILATTTFNDK
jgi:type 1 glutamine amidotransferase